MHLAFIIDEVIGGNSGHNKNDDDDWCNPWGS